MAQHMNHSRLFLHPFHLRWIIFQVPELAGTFSPSRPEVKRIRRTVLVSVTKLTRVSVLFSSAFSFSCASTIMQRAHQRSLSPLPPYAMTQSTLAFVAYTAAEASPKDCF